MHNDVEHILYAYWPFGYITFACSSFPLFKMCLWLFNYEFVGYIYNLDMYSLLDIFDVSSSFFFFFFGLTHFNEQKILFQRSPIYQYFDFGVSIFVLFTEVHRIIFLCILEDLLFYFP